MITVTGKSQTTYRTHISVRKLISVHLATSRIAIFLKSQIFCHKYQIKSQIFFGSRHVEKLSHVSLHSKSLVSDKYNVVGLVVQ